MSLTKPAPLTSTHDVEAFACGVDDLDEWLKRRALMNDERGAARTFVVCNGNRVVGYYALAAGAVRHGDAYGAMKRNMPDPVPMIVLGRLAVDKQAQGFGLGGGLLRDALLRGLQAGEHIGVAGVLVDATNQQARSFYEKFGFRPSPVSHLKLMVTIGEVRRVLALRDEGAGANAG